MNVDADGRAYPLDDLGEQDQVNRRVYHSRKIVREYLSPALWRAEIIALLKYQPRFADRDILDLGVGAGRTARFLAPLAHRYEAIDYSPAMVEYMQQAMPEISVRLGDMRDLTPFQPRSFDFVLGANNVISAVSHEGRMKTLNEVGRVLRPGGIFMFNAFNAHNRRYRFAMRGPRLRVPKNPVTLARNALSYGLSIVNHARIGKLRHVEREQALLNDDSHDYALLHYHIDRGRQRAELADFGFRLLEVFNDAGRSLGAGDSDDDSFCLMYVAQRVPEIAD